MSTKSGTAVCKQCVHQSPEHMENGHCLEEDRPRLRLVQDNSCNCYATGFHHARDAIGETVHDRCIARVDVQMLGSRSGCVTASEECDSCEDAHSVQSTLALHIGSSE